MNELESTKINTIIFDNDFLYMMYGLIGGLGIMIIYMIIQLVIGVGFVN